MNSLVLQKACEATKAINSTKNTFYSKTIALLFKIASTTIYLYTDCYPPHQYKCLIKLLTSFVILVFTDKVGSLHISLQLW